MQKTFDTPAPIDLYVELGSGDLDLRCDEVAQTTVDILGRNAEDVVVEQRGEQIVVLAPSKKMGFMVGLGSSDQLRVSVSLPHGSRLTTKLGSADVTASGRLGDTRVRTGSGAVRLDEVDGDAQLETGSGDVEIAAVHGELRIKSGSGDLRVREAGEDVALSTASGDLVVDTMRRGQLAAKNVSGDIQVGIPAGVPVWTDISSVTGSVHSNLQGAGQPAEGQDYVELRAKTVSGDVLLQQV